MMRRYLVPIALWIALGCCIVYWVRSGETEPWVVDDNLTDAQSESSAIADNEVPANWPTEKKLQFYIGKLKDREYTRTYGHGYTWYTAAEELGQIGKPAIPPLLERLETKDDYERSVALYALMLASQAAELKQATNGEFIDVEAWETKQHASGIKSARDWWSKWGHLWK